VRWVTFVAWAAYRLRGLTLVGRNWGGGMKNKGAGPWSGATGCRKSAARSLASRRQKARLCLAPTMSQGAKNYKIRQPPPLPGAKFASAKTRLAPSPTLNSITKTTEAVCALQSKSPPASISFLSCHFERNSTQTRAFPFSTGKENFRQPCDFLICDF
jgi:hypothetical protein